MSSPHKKQKTAHIEVGKSSIKLTERVVFNTEEKMVSIPTCFHSGSCKLDANFYLPRKCEADGEVKDKSIPLFIVCSGFTGLNSIHPSRYSRFLTRLGYPCFAFDYRGFEASEGERKKVLLEEQIEDIVNAVSFCYAHQVTKGHPIILMGWGMAGGMILEASRLTPKLKGLISANGFFNSPRVQKALRGEKKNKEFLDWLEEERGKAAITGKLPEVDPFKIYPLDPVSEEYVNRVLRAVPGYNEGAQVRLDFADSLIRFAPENQLDHLHDTPLLVVHGEINELHPVAEPMSLLAKYPGQSDVYWVPEAGHTEWMLDDNEKFQNVVRNVDAWAKSL